MNDWTSFPHFHVDVEGLLEGIMCKTSDVHVVLKSWDAIVLLHKHECNFQLYKCHLQAFLLMENWI